MGHILPYMDRLIDVTNLWGRYQLIYTGGMLGELIRSFNRYLPNLPLPLYSFAICEGFYCLHVVFHVWILKTIDVILTLRYAVQSDNWFDGTHFTIYGVI